MTINQPLVSIIIPALNEEARLARTLIACIEFLQQQDYASELLVVTDGSTDRTQEVAESFVSSFPNLRVLSFPYNRGKGFAVKKGMFEAKGAYKLFMDADYAVSMDFFPSFLKQIQSGYDIVFASRTQKGAKVSRRQPLHRHCLGFVFRRLQKTVLRFPFLDTQCGFKLFTAESAAILFPRVTFDCAYFDAELLYLAYKLKMKIYEHAVTWHHHPDSHLSIGPKRTMEILGQLFSIAKIHAND